MLVLAGVAAAITLIALLTREREPSYSGKPLSFWVVQLCPMNPSSPGKPEAEKAIRHIGTNAIPYLLKWVSYEEPELRGIRQTVINAKDQFPITLRKRIPSSVDNWVSDVWNYGKNGGAPEAFAILGTVATPAIPDLERLLQDTTKTNTCRMALYSLAAISTNSIPLVATRLTDPDAQQRIWAMEAVYCFPTLRTNAQPLVPLLVHCLSHPDKSVRRRAAYTLGCIADTDRTQSAYVVPALTNSLRASVDSVERAGAIRALGRHGEQALAAVPLLLQETTDLDKSVRSAATNALLKIAPEALTNAAPQ